MPDIEQSEEETCQPRRFGLRYVLLALLAQGPNTGYALGRLLRTRLRHVWEARLQQIYGELALLRAAGLVKVTTHELRNRPTKKVYTLSASGLAELDSWLKQSPDAVHHRDHLLARLLCLDRLGPEVFMQHLRNREHALAAQLRGLDALMASVRSTAADGIAELLTLEATVLRLRAELTWCERTQEKLAGIGASARARLSQRGKVLGDERSSSPG